MKSTEYETELKELYRMAIKQGDIPLALDILERGSIRGLQDMKKGDKSAYEEYSIGVLNEIIGNTVLIRKENKAAFCDEFISQITSMRKGAK